VTKSQRVAVWACLAAVSLAVSQASAQAPPRPSIALLDINYIFKNHTRFKAMMADMKAEVEQAEAQMKRQREEMQRLNEQLKELKPGTAEYKQLESHIVSGMADLNAQAQLQRKEFLLKESGIYYTVYREIQQVVNYYAASQGFTVVLKVNGEEVKEDKPDDVLRYINQDVVWAAQGLNITNVILEQLNQRAVSATRATVPSRPGVPFPR